MTVVQLIARAEADRIEAPARCGGCPVRHRGLCALLGDGEINALHAISRHLTLPAGTTIPREGPRAVASGRIVSGLAKVVSRLEDGRQQLVALLFPSDIFGLFHLGPSKHPTRFDVVTASDTVLCQYSTGGLKTIVETFPELETKLLRSALTELEGAREWHVVLGRMTAGERVATFFHRYIARALREQDMAGDGLPFPLSRSDVAAALDLTLETVSRHIAHLKRSGAIAFEGTHIITGFDLAALASLSGTTDHSAAGD
ncbi:MAG: Crp/Fnr family transcriptional regulator [Pseudomonadota bacterium]